MQFPFNEPGFEARNAAKMWVFAAAAYPDKISVREKLIADFMDAGGTAQFIDADDAEIIVCTLGNQIYIGIAGTESLDDWITNISLFSLRVSDWGSHRGIDVAEDARDVRGCTGFLRHTAIVYHAIDQALGTIGQGINEFDSIWIAGHSLGGAVANCLTFTDRFKAARVFSYGGPKYVKRMSVCPDRPNSIAIRNYRDPVPMLLMTCKHPVTMVFITPNMAEKRRWYVSLVYFLMGISSSSLYAMGCGMKSAHSLKRYADDLANYLKR